jgi:tRNA G26 N,N-dimethylase Trm1
MFARMTQLRLLSLLRYVVANDLSAFAVEAIERNVKANDVGISEDENTKSAHENEGGKVHVSKGDAWCAFNSHQRDML